LENKVRLQKYLAECGECSRRKAEELILDGKVRVNTVVVKELGTKIIPKVDRVTVSNRLVYPPQKGAMLLNKPRGVVSTMSDPGQRETVAHYLTKKQKGYFPVGRLDYDSTGLVVLTNDGELAQRLSHPRYGFVRVYQVKVSGKISEKTLRRIERGVRLPDGVVKAGIKITKRHADATSLEISISVGRNRVIRRLMDHLRHPVQQLHRISHGPIKIGKLKPGHTHLLSDKEYERVVELVMGKADS